MEAPNAKRMNDSQRIFILHASELLTDHRAHGDGLLAYRYIRELAERGHHLTVACEQVDLASPLPSNVDIHHIPLRKKFGALRRLEYAFKVRALFHRLHSKQPFTLLHQLNPVFTGISLAFIGSRLPLILGPYVTHWEATHPSLRRRVRDGVSNLLTRLQQHHANVLLLSRPSAKSRVLSNRHRSGSSTPVLPYGIDLAMFPEQPFAEDFSTILYLGGLDKRKGIFVLLEAFEKIASALPNARLLLAGEGRDRSQAMDLRENSPYRDRIIFLGEIKRQMVPELLAQATLLCLPSYGEPYGMSLIEAMATGRPIVATNCGGPADLVDPRGGFLVPVGDAQALAGALTSILSSPETARAMGAFNRRKVASYNWPLVITQLERVYQEAVHLAASPKTVRICPTTLSQL